LCGADKTTYQINADINSQLFKEMLTTDPNYRS